MLRKQNAFITNKLICHLLKYGIMLFDNIEVKVLSNSMLLNIFYTILP